MNCILKKMFSRKSMEHEEYIKYWEMLGKLKKGSNKRHLKVRKVKGILGEK